jgi:hypothetical protein
LSGEAIRKELYLVRRNSPYPGENPLTTTDESVAHGSGRRRWFIPLLLLLSLAVVPRVVLMILLPPGSDVYYVDSEAALALSTGQNPYDHTFTTIPLALATPGAAHIFAYLPFTVIYLVPFYLMGDVRFGLVVADVLIGYCIYSIGGRWRTVASAVFLFAPFSILLSTVYVNNLLIGALFVSLFFVLEKRSGGRAGAFSLGIALATSLLIWLVFPFVAYRYIRTGRWVLALLAASVAGIIMLPFVAATGPSTFVYQILTFQFTRPTLPLVSYIEPIGYNINPALSAITLSLFHFALPGVLRVALVLLALPLCMKRATDQAAMMLQASLFATVAIFVLPNNLFWAYAELPIVTFLLFVASGEIQVFLLRNHDFLTLKSKKNV